MPMHGMYFGQCGVSKKYSAKLVNLIIKYLICSKTFAIIDISSVEKCEYLGKMTNKADWTNHKIIREECYL